MNTAAVRANRRKLLILAAIVLLCAAGYMLVDVNFSNPKLLAYAMKIRTPKLIVMLITAFSIGGASLVYPHPHGGGVFPGILQYHRIQRKSVLRSGRGAHGNYRHDYL